MTRRRSIPPALALALPLALAVAPTPLAAQSPFAARAVATGGAYMGLARGNEAVFYNPAHLALPQTPAWSISLAQTAVGATLLGAGLADVPELADHHGLTDARRAELLAAIPDAGAEVDFDLRFPGLAISRGPVGFGITYGSVGRHTLGRDLVDLVLNGYEAGRSDYRVGNTAGSRASYWDFALAYGRRTGPLHLGATAHHVRGGTLVSSRLFEPRIDLEAQDLELEYVGVLARGGSGYGLDLGAALQPAPGLTLSASVTNAFSRMTWSESLRVRQVTVDRADVEGASPIDLLNRYSYSEQDLDPAGASLRVIETARGLYDRAYFPAVAQLAATLDLRTRTQLTGAFSRRLTDGRLAGGWDTMAGAAIQQKLPLISVRAGYSTDTGARSLLGAGVTLGPMDLGVARRREREADGALRDGWVASFRLGVLQPPLR